MEYIGGISAIHWGCSVNWGYHEYSGGGDIMINVGLRSLGKQLNLYRNPSVLNIPLCTHDIPSLIMVSPSVLMVSFSVTMISPSVFMISSTVLNTLCVLMISPVYSVISPSVLHTPGELNRQCRVSLATSHIFFSFILYSLL